MRQSFHRAEELEHGLTVTPSFRLETFDPFATHTAATEAALYGGADWCPWDPYGNYLCICA
jgi:hypothetical protein